MDNQYAGAPMPDRIFWEQWSGTVLVTLDPSPGDARPDFSRIIAATTDAERLPELVDWVTEAALRAGSHVYLLVAIDQGDERDDADLRVEYQQAQEILAAITTRLRLLGMHVNWEVRFGSIGEEVVTLATTTGTGVVALERPRATGEPSDVELVLAHLRQFGSGICLLVGPAPKPPANGYVAP